MAQLLVRNLEDELIVHLKKRAVDHGVSMEEEHRRILREVLLAGEGKKKSFWEAIGEMPAAGDDSIFERSRSTQGRADATNPFDS